jgi:hypothetical protein
MPEALESAQPEYEVQISQQPHAFLVANITIHDLGQGRNVELGLNGIKFKASVGTEALRTAPNLTGIWRATMFIRTKPNAMLERVTQIRRLRALPPNNVQAPFWTCTGEIINLEPETGILEIKVQTRSAAHFSLFVQCNAEQIKTLKAAKYAHLTGTLEQQRLIVTNLEPRASIENEKTNPNTETELVRSGEKQ